MLTQHLTNKLPASVVILCALEVEKVWISFVGVLSRYSLFVMF